MSINTIDEIKEWVETLNKTIKVDIKKTGLSKINNWFFDTDTGTIHNTTNSFFSIIGVKAKIQNSYIAQPLILQEEIGVLGLIKKKINNEFHYLIQAKIEPGNVNKIQLSPTVQATKSNVDRLHNGKQPLYIQYFQNDNYLKVYDNLQTEQNTKFLGKQNRNVIVELKENENIEVHKNFAWITLDQIQQLLKIDNLVNMDLRSVLSFEIVTSLIKDDKQLNLDYYNNFIQNQNKKKSVDREIVNLQTLENWQIEDNCIFDKNNETNMKVVYADINIEGREVNNWGQPLVESIEKQSFILFVKKLGKGLEVLVKPYLEIGNKEGFEFGPTLKLDPFKNKTGLEERLLEVTQKLEPYKKVILSEEGGRFYHEENNNIVYIVKENDINISKKELESENYIWIPLNDIQGLLKNTKFLNIELRNLLSLL